MGTFPFRSGVRMLDEAERDLLRSAGWNLGTVFSIGDDDRSVSRPVYEKPRPDGVLPPYRIEAAWDWDEEVPPMVVSSEGWTPDFGLLLDDMEALGLEGRP